jgi:hypothetical protein
VSAMNFERRGPIHRRSSGSANVNAHHHQVS